ncbi:unnamed protein product [Arctogadus glacialis]
MLFNILVYEKAIAPPDVGPIAPQTPAPSTPPDPGPFHPPRAWSLHPPRSPSSPPSGPSAMADPSWWKLTFTRKKKSEAKVLYEIPADHDSNTGKKSEQSPGSGAAPGSTGPMDSQLSARLEKIVDKSATKGRHVKVSHSGRFKEKKKVRSTLAENPNLFPEHSLGSENQKNTKHTEK